MRLLFCLLALSSAAFAEIRLTVGGRESAFREAVVDCQLHGRFLIRHLKLTFYNQGKRVAEGDLTCPLELGEEIVSFAMDVNGVRREGVVVPKKRGKIAYETIVRRGVDPGLIEVDEVTNEFRTRVFPIPAKGIKTVWITTVQTVEAGEVRVWPKGLGWPDHWNLSLETAGGEAGDFQKKQRGDSESEPVASISWKPTPDLSYGSDQGDVSFVKKTAAKLSAEKIEIWFDGSAKISPLASRRLSELMELYQEAKVTLRVFREEIGVAQEFTLAAGLAPGLFEAISEIYRIGMARPRGLPWKTVHADAVILITDGAFASGQAGLGETPCPLHVIDSGEGKSRWLRSLALRSGGGWHSVEKIDPMMGCVESGVSLLGEVMDQWMAVKPVSEGIETPIAKWLWARLRSQEMNDLGIKRAEIDGFNYRHGVMDSSSSMIVMETARQYQEFKIEPPKEDEKLYREWMSLRKSREGKEKRNFDDLAKAWEKRCDALGGSELPLGERIKLDVEGKLERLKRIESFHKSDSLINLDLVRNELFAIQKLCEEGIERGGIPKVKEHFARLVKLEESLRVEIPWVDITIGGQVKKPGSISLQIGATLFEAVELAGGATPFGAMNRVKLYRKGQVHTYNLKTEAHRKVKLYPGDLVEVPEKNWKGNGGSGGRKKAPFSAEASLQLVFEKGDENPSKYYVEALAKVMSDDSQWEGQYRTFRSTFGWRADFYLNVIEFLIEKN